MNDEITIQEIFFVVGHGVSNLAENRRKRVVDCIMKLHT